MLDVYTVTAPSVLENFLDYRSAEDFRNRCVVKGYHEVTLLHRKVSAEGGSLDQRKIEQQDAERKFGTTDLYRGAVEKAAPGELERLRVEPEL